MAKADNQVEESAVTEQEKPQDLRKFVDVVKDEDGNETNQEYAVAEFNDEQKLIYNKLEVIVANDQKLETQYQFSKEQNSVLSNHYVSELKKLLSSGEDDEPEVVENGEAEEESK
jgi:hypothetical protein